MIDGGRRLRKVVKQLLPLIRPGVDTETIDRTAEQMIVKEGGQSSFKKVKDYYWSTCLPVNEQIVHTPPSSRVLKNGDVLTLDIGMYYRGFHTDYATTVIVGQSKDRRVADFLSTGQKTLFEAIDKAVNGSHIGDISLAIQKGVSDKGYHVVKPLTGHGIGRNLHEDPYVYGYLSKRIGKTPLIRPGLTIAIEVIYAMGTENIAYEEGDDWSIVTEDRSLSACFEHTVAVTDKKTLILT